MQSEVRLPVKLHYPAAGSAGRHHKGPGGAKTKQVHR